MKRPILIITIGFITGIIWGLYFNIVPFILLVVIGMFLIIEIASINNKKHFIKIIKIFIKNNVILLFFISVFVANKYLINYNKRYEAVYEKFSKQEIIGTIISNRKETEYKNIYIIKLDEYKDINFLLKVSKKINMEYGDKVKIHGEYILPEESRNYDGFNYREYLKTQKVYGIFEANNIKILEHNSLSKIELFSNYIKQRIITNINKILPEDTRQLFLGILLGYNDNLSEDIQESFRKSSLSHLLAVSGAHITYIILGLSYLLRKLSITKNTRNLLTTLFLIFFMYITGFTSSVVRASIMGIILLFSIVFHRKNDIKTSLSLSILLILINNPYKILDVGLLLSYFATIGIICFSKLISKSKKSESNMYIKVINYLKEMILITIFANIFVIPIIIYNFNTVSLTFILSNLIAGILIGPITIGGLILIFISFINIKFAYVLALPYNLLLELLMQSARLTSLIPLSEIFVSTPNSILIIIYYLILFLYISYKILNKKYSNRYLVKKISKYMQAFFKYLRKRLKSTLIYVSVCIILISLISRMIPKNLKIYFIDVGQGDSTLIVTPSNKKVLIDSGGSDTGKFDVGKSVLVPYLLDRKITVLDYICISHFDSDHCKGFIYLLNNIKVKNIILSKQYEITQNFEEIISIANKKKIKILRVEAGDDLKIDKYIKIRILSPGKELTKDINDNSIVMKLEYNDFTCLFTGDISKNIEKHLLNVYGKNVKSDVLKVAHHRFKDII